MPKTRELIELRIDVGVTPDQTILHGIVRVVDSDDQIEGRREFPIPMSAQLATAVAEVEARALARINTVVAVTRPIASEPTP